MTLILTATHSLFTIQVSDRLLTKREREFDRKANKTILFKGKDCVMCMSYTGIAHLNKKHTDDYIATIIEPICGKVSSGAFFGAPPKNDIFECNDIGKTLLKIKGNLESINDSEFIKNKFELIITGWQGLWKKKKKPRSTMYEIIKEKNSKKATITNYSSDRILMYFNAIKFSINPKGYLSYKEQKRLFNGINDYIKSTTKKHVILTVKDHVEFIEKRLLETIRMVSSRESTVGNDCMSIFLPHPRLIDRGLYGYIKFSAQETNYKKIEMLNKVEDIQIAYTPWVISCNTANSPSSFSISGGPVNNMGGYIIEFKGAPTRNSDSKVNFMMGNPDRKSSH